MPMLGTELLDSLGADSRERWMRESEAAGCRMEAL